MSDNKMMAIIVIAICAAITITVSFRPDAFEDVSVTKFKASEKTKQLEELARNYEVELGNTRQNLASVGKTSSSVRSRSEQLLQEQNAGLVESVGKKFSFQTGGLERQQASAERDLPLELERLRDKSNQARIEALRRAEAEVGSGALSGYADLFGGIGGDLPRKQVTDALSFSSNWLF